MRKNIPIALLMLIIISVFTLSCKKKSIDEPTPQSNCETKYEVIYGDLTSNAETALVNYENGQIKLISASSAKLNFEYSTDKVMVLSSGVPVYQIDITNKLATRIIDLGNQSEQRMTYDGNRNLIKIDAYLNNNLTDTKILTYSNGNLATLTQTYPDEPAVKRVTTYSYSTDIATNVDTDTRYLIFGPIDFNVPSSLTGTISRNILSGSLYTYTSGNYRSDITKAYTYTRNGSGVVNKIIENTHSVTVSNGVQTLDERTKQTILINTTCN
ncbi:hypothetical protein EV200_101180 [Pedobacter psychrotolerans]|uniref:DUF4595 domain-containing protein n=1 Tax=Pedobacter psychrotolerans TaxID=1843235 RepID=A0A4R2HM99_9SPHI|nr:hypothetical protein [Pedobacter psychrotolerans]TCO30742.1 hypothetical protein EV200_101180 [Pedobacter psychrotolerans]GGE44762.1 hypothetical protein GCM10011413_08630 [Pedobacter psychrotolerans]